MSAHLCSHCGYPRNVDVAGCEHATLPSPAEAESLEEANALREVERLRAEAAIVGDELVALQRKVQAYEAELETERRANGRLRSEHRDAEAKLLAQVNVAVAGLADLAMPTTRADYSTAELDRVVCDLAAQTLGAMGLNPAECIRARLGEREPCDPLVVCDSDCECREGE